jgi:hypothetical protein
VVQRTAQHAGRLRDVLHGRVAEPAPPEQQHGAVEHLVFVELFCACHGADYRDP